MHNGASRKFAKISASLILGIMLFVFLGLAATSTAMAHGGHEGFEGCPLMANQSTLCGMTSEEHLSLWQRLYHASLHIVDAVILIALLGALGSYIAVLMRLLWRRSVFRGRSPDSLYERNVAPDRVTSIPLVKQFSKGILNPKRY